MVAFQGVTFVGHVCGHCSVTVVFFFKQKTAYEMLISDWSSDVCSSDLLAFARQRFGAADILINNAGIFRIGSLADFDLDAIAPMSALNYDAVVRASSVFARELKAAGSGAIVNIHSIGAHLTATGAGAIGRW